MVSRLKFTLDRNILIAVSKGEADTVCIAKLFKHHSSGTISIAISAANRVENQKNGNKIQPIDDLIDMCKSIGLIPLPEFLGYPFDWEMGLWEHSIISRDAFELELEIHNLLFPSIVTYRSDEQSKVLQRKITNAKCDVFAIWAHIYFERDYFVTNDKNFHTKSQQLVCLGAKNIVTPQQALKFVKNT